MPLPELLRATLPPTPLLSSFSLPKLTLPGSLGVVVDGCAGRGTIPLAAAAGSAGYGIAGEYDADSARLLERVFARQRAATADGLQWDARALPLRDGVADSYVTDLPFGLKCLSTKQMEMGIQRTPQCSYGCMRVRARPCAYARARRAVVGGGSSRSMVRLRRSAATSASNAFYCSR